MTGHVGRRSILVEHHPPLCMPAQAGRLAGRGAGRAGRAGSRRGQAGMQTSKPGGPSSFCSRAPVRQCRAEAQAPKARRLHTVFSWLGRPCWRSMRRPPRWCM
jgi:hypothetical protein